MGENEWQSWPWNLRKCLEGGWLSCGPRGWELGLLCLAVMLWKGWPQKAGRMWSSQGKAECYVREEQRRKSEPTALELVFSYLILDKPHFHTTEWLFLLLSYWLRNGSLQVKECARGWEIRLTPSSKQPLHRRAGEEKGRHDGDLKEEIDGTWTDHWETGSLSWWAWIIHGHFQSPWCNFQIRV